MTQLTKWYLRPSETYKQFIWASIFQRIWWELNVNCMVNSLLGESLLISCFFQAKLWEWLLNREASMFCCTLFYVHSSNAIILMGKRELVALLNLSPWCLVMVELLFLAVPRGYLRFVIVVFPDHTHLLFLSRCQKTQTLYSVYQLSSWFTLQTCD